MVGIKWRNFVVYSNEDVSVDSIVIDEERYDSARIVFGWSRAEGFDFYVKYGDGSVFDRHGDRVIGEFVELTPADYEEYKKMVEIAKDVEREYRARMKEIEIESGIFKLDKDDINYYDGYYVYPRSENLVFIGEIPDVRTDGGFEEYITEYVRVVRSLWKKWREIVDELEKKYWVRIVFD